MNDMVLVFNVIAHTSHTPYVKLIDFKPGGELKYGGVEAPSTLVETINYHVVKGGNGE